MQVFPVSEARKWLMASTQLMHYEKTYTLKYLTRSLECYRKESTVKKIDGACTGRLKYVGSSLCEKS